MTTARTPLLCAALLLGACQAPTPTTAPRAASARPPAAVADAGYRPRTRRPAITDPIAQRLFGAALDALEAERRVRCENIANVNTCGYKRRFVRTTTQTIADGVGNVYSLPRVLDVAACHTMGVLELTERSLDFAIDGAGFLAVEHRDGSTAYTRCGRLQVDADGRFVTPTGNIVLPQIVIPNDTLEVAITPDGFVSGRTAGAPDCMTGFGQLQLHRFINPLGLRLEGDLLRPTEASGRPITGQPGLMGLGTLKQGFLERSNVELQTEMMGLEVLEQRHAALATLGEHLGMLTR